MPIINAKGMIDIAGLKCLVIDHDRFARNIMRKTLDQIDIKGIIESDGGPEMANILKQHNVDIIFISQEPLTQKAFDLIRFLRKPSDSVPNPRIPIIFVSGKSDEATVKQAKDAGITDFIIKPISAAIIQKRLNLLMLKLNNIKQD
jgi:response regulator RpfG family c-di-GMP phosphodiesterase